mmetsp:Transcript_7111/g.17091  ORF Transcript_7111/g.17091 Transcript_7111/m.17091 type:complete len:491 (-) Transcript_7111:410-1882(-)
MNYLASALLLLFVAHASAQKPNVVLIFVDDLSYADIGPNGATDLKTPNLDRLAASGVNFANGYVTHHFCGPSRAGLLTGRYQARIGMEANVAYAPMDHFNGAFTFADKILPQHLKRGGYRTGITGKWNLGASPPNHPLNKGFDFLWGFLGGGHNYYTIDTRTALHKNNIPLNSVMEGYFAPIYDGITGGDFTGYVTDRITDAAIEFMEDKSDDPFFLYVPYNAPHTPLQAPKRLVDKYAGISNPRRQIYLAMVDSIDENIGRILDSLEDSGKRENTIIWFIGDNGGVYPSERSPLSDYGDNGGLRNGKGAFYDGGIKVPFIGSWPAKWPAGIKYDSMVISLDVAATALAEAGVDMSGFPKMEGINLTPFLQKTAEGEPHNFLYWRDVEQGGLAIRSPTAKLVKPNEDSPLEFYLIAQDPFEKNNTIDLYEDWAKRLAERWNTWNRGNIGSAVQRASVYHRQLYEYRQEKANALREKAKAEIPYQIPLEDL